MSRKTGFKIFKSGRFDDISVRKTEEVPVVKISEFQAPTQGGILYEPGTKKIYYADGNQWNPVGGGGVGTVTSVTAGIGLNGTPNPIVAVGTIDLADTTVIPGIYGNALNVPQITVDQQGRLTNAVNIPLSAVPGVSKSFSLLKDINQVILPGVNTILTNWAVVPSPPYHDNTGNWNALTGIYTATTNITLTIDVTMSWLGGISNLGNRVLRIIYQPFAGLPMVAKEAVTQADANTAVATTQEATICLLMDVGDEAWIEVSHSAPVNLTVASGNVTTTSGIEIKI